MIVAQEKPNYGYAEQQVQEPQPRGSRRPRHDRAWCLSTAVLFIVAVVFGIAINYFNYHLAGVGYHLATLKTEVARLETENQHLEAALGRVDSLERVEVIATQKLGMVVPSEHNVMYIALNQPVDEPSKGSIAGKRSTPAGSGEGLALLTPKADEPDGIWQAFLRVICQRDAGNG